MAMGSMPMPGGWMMSMAWVRMPGETWTFAAISFVFMWVVMMAAMMLPSLAPTLWRYRQAMASAGSVGASRRTAVLALGYFVVWAALGLLVFPLGAALATLTMHHGSLARAVPVAAGISVLIAGAFQCTEPKARQLACCRSLPERSSAWSTVRASTAWHDGVRLGVHCSYCSAGLTMILLAFGIMDVRAMAAVTAAITLERLAPAGQRVAQGIGVMAIGAGLVLIAQAIGIG